MKNKHLYRAKAKQQQKNQGADLRSIDHEKQEKNETENITKH